MRPGGWSPDLMESVGIVFTKDNRHQKKKKTSLPLPPEDSEPEAKPCWNLDPGLSSLQNYEKMFLLFKSSSLWCFAMAA